MCIIYDDNSLLLLNYNTKVRADTFQWSTGLIDINIQYFIPNNKPHSIANPITLYSI